MNCCIAVFDVCGTLYRSNTTFDFLEFYWKERKHRVFLLFFRLSRTMIGRIFWLILSNLYDRELFRRLAVRTLRGQIPSDVDDAARKFVKTVLPSKRISEVFILMDIYRRDGAEIVLLSASLDPVVKAIASELNIRRYFCSLLEEKDRQYSGNYYEDIRGCKKEIFLNEIGECVEFVFVTDNKEDLPLLEYSTLPYIVVRKKYKKFWKINQPTHANLMEIE